MDKPGYVDGKPIFEHADTIRQLKRDNDYQTAAELLLRLIDATEAESKAEGWGVAPWYYEQAAIIYKKLGDPHNERAVLERFAQQKHAPGTKPAKLIERLSKICENA